MKLARAGVAGTASVFAMLVTYACGSDDHGDGTTVPNDDRGTSPDTGAVQRDAQLVGEPEPEHAVSSEASSDGADEAGPEAAETDATPPLGEGHVLFHLPDGLWYRIAAKSGATREAVSPAIATLSSGADDWLSMAKDSAWLASVGSRYGCRLDECLSLFDPDLATGEQPTTKELGPARAAVSSGGNVVVFAAVGPHALDLFAMRRSDGVWGAPVLLTGDSPFSYHHDVAIAADGSRAVFDCGSDEYGQPPTSVCEAPTSGAGTQVLVKSSSGPDQSPNHAIHHADYTPEGDVIFEADWPSEQVWKLTRSTRALTKISPDSQSDDNSPCVLSDGRIASLWLGRDGNSIGRHELKVMSADGSTFMMLLTGLDITDIGISCGN